MIKLRYNTKELIIFKNKLVKNIVKKLIKTGKFFIRGCINSASTKNICSGKTKIELPQKKVPQPNIKSLNK